MLFSGISLNGIELLVAKELVPSLRLSKPKHSQDVQRDTLRHVKLLLEENLAQSSTSLVDPAETGGEHSLPVVEEHVGLAFAFLLDHHISLLTLVLEGTKDAWLVVLVDVGVVGLDLHLRSVVELANHVQVELHFLLDGGLSTVRNVGLIYS